MSNIKLRLLAKKDFINTSSNCLLSGHCLDFELIRLEKAIKSVCSEYYSMEYEDVDKNDKNVPILLKNNRFVKVFESVASTYALSKYNEVDQTLFYAPIYALFFGMMSEMPVME